jgi:hypothetical protein
MTDCQKPTHRGLQAGLFSLSVIAIRLLAHALDIGVLSDRVSTLRSRAAPLRRRLGEARTMILDILAVASCATEPCGKFGKPSLLKRACDSAHRRLHAREAEEGEQEIRRGEAGRHFQRDR